MRHRMSLITGILALSTLLAPSAGGAVDDATSLMPPNQILIMRALQARGDIPAEATPSDALAIYRAYVKKKLDRRESQADPLGAAAIRRAEVSRQPVNRHGRVVRPNNQRFDNVLTLLVEFEGSDGGLIGPLHNELPPLAPDDNTSFWVPDFNRDHYQGLLFDHSPRAKSMANFYLEQSGHRYTLDGFVTHWVAVDRSEWWYGADDVAGTDNLNGPVWRLVADAVAVACDVPWEQFDTEDPYDIDLDGVLAEPDGYVDHIQFVHAGKGQESGGGAQGDASIWSHSWWADFGSHGPGYGGVQTCDPNVWVGAYTMNPEDGNIGVFVHEYGHNLGLPDLYDTIYSGDASTGNWTAMSYGSWLACPDEALGSCPANFGVWEKWVLGWLDPVVVHPGEQRDHILLRSAETAGPANKAILVTLPDYEYPMPVNQPHSGSYEWYGGRGNALNNTLMREFTLPFGAVLGFWTWFDIETDWDYGYVEVSTDGGVTWDTVPGEITTNTDPNGNNPEGNGITGNSGGWIEASFDLSAYGGTTVSLRFRYETDAYVEFPGWTIDDITIAGFFDDCEAGNLGWTSDGWEIFDGVLWFETFHYYLAEWRTPRGFDVSMNNWHNYVQEDTVEYVSASPGMLLWYRNGRYADNWVGVHPWAGRLLAVDAHPGLVWTPEYPVPFRTTIQMADAVFGLQSTPEQPLSYCYNLPTNSHLPALDPVPTFDDSLTYADKTIEPILGPWWINFAISSVETPTYGLKIHVTGSNPSAGKVAVDFGDLTP